MFLILVISATVFIPHAHSLNCTREICQVHDECESKEEQCEAEYTRCGVVRMVSYQTITFIPDEATNYTFTDVIVSDVVYKACIKADTCKNASYSSGIFKRLYATMCCDTDMCNAAILPSLPSHKTDPNGSKCHRCGDENTTCNATMDCTADETQCFTETKGENVYKGCATQSFCVNPPSIVESHMVFSKCCEGDLCNIGSSSTSVCLTLLTNMLISLFIFLK